MLSWHSCLGSQCTVEFVGNCGKEDLRGGGGSEETLQDGYLEANTHSNSGPS